MVRLLRRPTNDDYMKFLLASKEKIIKFFTHPLTVFLSILIVLLLTPYCYYTAYSINSGILEYTENQIYDVRTNWTVGFMLFWPLLGGLSAVIQLKVLKLNRKIVPMITAIVCLVVAVVLDKVGIQGFRW